MRRREGTATDVATLRPLVAEELASHAAEWWVLLSATATPIGFLGYANDAIEGLFIDPDHFGQGWGRLLVAHAQNLATGALAVDVNEENAGAVRFLLLIMSLVFAIPILMSVLSLTLKDNANRRANRATGTFFVLFDLVFLVFLVWPFSYETVWAVMYLVFTAMVAWHAWKWPRSAGSVA